MDFTSLSLNDQIKLFYLLTLTWEWENEQFEASRIQVLSTDKYASTYVSRLQMIGALENESEETHEMYNCDGFVIPGTHRYKIMFEIAPAILQELRNKTYFMAHIEADDLAKNFKTTMAKCAFNTFCKYLQERELEICCSNTYDLLEFVRLFEHLSYSQVLYLCYRVAVNLSDKVVTGSLQKTVAGKNALKDVYAYYKWSIRNDWNISYRKIDVEQLDTELKFFLDYILCGNYCILKEKITPDNIKPNDIL